MSSHASLDAAAQERKARLAQLKSLKRKQPSADDGPPAQPDSNSDPPRDGQQDEDTAIADAPSVSNQYLSGRNYDASLRAPKLGFENSPAANGPTLEEQADEIARTTRAQQAAEEQADRPLDLFQLQPKKPNWDLKRDLQRKLDVLDVRTDNAIARIVRERIEGQQKAKASQAARDEATVDQLEGAGLVEAMHIREREEQEDERREREQDAEDGLA